jgi:hypothetical protein
MKLSRKALQCLVAFNLAERLLMPSELVNATFVEPSVSLTLSIFPILMTLRQHFRKRLLNRKTVGSTKSYWTNRSELSRWVHWTITYSESKGTTFEREEEHGKSKARIKAPPDQDSH